MEVKKVVVTKNINSKIENFQLFFMRGHLRFNIGTHNSRANCENILKRLKFKSERKFRGPPSPPKENRTAASYLPRL
jgi:hypothetical protein